MVRGSGFWILNFEFWILDYIYVTTPAFGHPF